LAMASITLVKGLFPGSFFYCCLHLIEFWGQ
jgi:hypothetical protein